MLAIFIGAVGGLIVVLAIPMLDKFKIDDVVKLFQLFICRYLGTIAASFQIQMQQ